MYVYLAPGGKVLSFDAAELPLLPSKAKGRELPAPYARGLEYGSCLKLYNYRWGGSAKSLATTNARAELEKWLYTLCLPVRITETRDYKAHFFQTTLSGLSANFADQGDGEKDARLEPGFRPASASISPKGIGRLPVTITVSKARDAKGKLIRKSRIPRGVVLTINGQVHTRLRPDFASSKLKFSTIAPYLHVAVDCSDMPPEISEEVFMTSRERHRSREVYDTIEEALVDVLREHQGLRELNARRRQQDLSEVLNDDEPARVLQALVKADPSIAALLGKGNRIHNPRVPEENGKPFQGQRFPTFFKITKEPKGGLVKDCPANKTCRVEFETDASNDYFVRGESPGRRNIAPDGMCIRESLFDGRYLAHFAPPAGCTVGEEIHVALSVTDDSRAEPLSSRFTVRVVKPVKNGTGGPSGKRRPRGGGQLGVPLPIMVTKDGRPMDGKPTQRWEDHEFDEYSAARIEDQGDQGVDVYINMDNRFLMNELSRETRASERPIIMYWFKYGLLLAALGVLQEHRRLEQDNERRKAGGSNGGGQKGNGEEDASVRLKSMHHALSGLASVIVPVIRRLAEGPKVD